MFKGKKTRPGILPSVNDGFYNIDKTETAIKAGRGHIKNRNIFPVHAIIKAKMLLILSLSLFSMSYELGEIH